jgi:hypothetical protein
MLKWASSLRLRFLCNPANPITTISSHLSPIPLIIGFKFSSLGPHYFKQESLLTLQRRDHVDAISIDRWCSGGLELWRALEKAFPMLGTPRESLSLSDATNLFSLRLEFFFFF